MDSVPEDQIFSLAKFLASPTHLSPSRRGERPSYPGDANRGKQAFAYPLAARRISVSLGTPVASATARQLNPCLRSLRTCSVSTSTAGLPNRTPRFLAAFCPAITRSRILQRSSSPTAPRIVNTIFPVGVEVSILSRSDTKSMPRRRAQPDWYWIGGSYRGIAHGRDRFGGSVQNQRVDDGAGVWLLLPILKLRLGSCHQWTERASCSEDGSGLSLILVWKVVHLEST